MNLNHTWLIPDLPTAWNVHLCIEHFDLSQEQFSSLRHEYRRSGIQQVLQATRVYDFFYILHLSTFRVISIKNNVRALWLKKRVSTLQRVRMRIVITPKIIAVIQALTFDDKFFKSRRILHTCKTTNVFIDTPIWVYFKFIVRTFDKNGNESTGWSFGDLHHHTPPQPDPRRCANKTLTLFKLIIT